MPGLDTNLVVRWLLDDDAAQSARVAELFAASAARNEPLFVPTTVLLELEWVLRSRYGFDRPAIVRAMNALLETEELLFENESLLEQVLDFFKHAPADFADCLHAGACVVAGHLPMLTFDRNATKVPGVELLGPSSH